MDEEKLLNKLGEAKLKRPKGIKKFIFEETDYRVTAKSGNYYVNTLEIWKDRLLMRTFAYKVPKNGKRAHNMDVQEVCRRLEGCQRVLLSHIESGMAGRKIDYTEKGEWGRNKDKKTCRWGWSWYSADKNNWWFCDYDMYDTDEWIELLEIPYCGYNHPNYAHKLPFIVYVELYRKYPKIELLAKCGWGHLIQSARYFNFDGKSFEQIFKMPKKWQKDMERLRISDILFIRKNNFEDYAEFMIASNMKRYSLITKYICKKMVEYIKSQEKYSMSIYNDYLRFAEDLGYPMYDRRILYPEDLKFAHDELMNKKENMDSAELNPGIKEAAKKLMKYKFKTSDLIIVPAQCNEELINESKVLDHCVRSYGDRVSQGETGIMFIRKSDEPKNPYFTLELQGKRIIQVRGNHNDAPLPEVQEFVKRWEKKFQLTGY